MSTVIVQGPFTNLNALQPGDITSNINIGGVGSPNRTVEVLRIPASSIVGTDSSANLVAYGFSELGVPSVFNKAVGQIADNTATTVLSITIPDPSATNPIALTFRVTAVGSLGGGGAVGAGEASGTASMDFALNRFPGAAAVFTASTVYGSATSASSGAATITLTLAAGSISGPANDVNTTTVTLKIQRGSGNSQNHYARIFCTVLGLNPTANSPAVTIS